MDNPGWYPVVPGVFLYLAGADPMDGELRDLPAAPEGRRQQSRHHCELGLELRGLSGVSIGNNDCHRISKHIRVYKCVLHWHMVLRI